MPPATLAAPARPMTARPKAEPTDHKYITRTAGYNGGEPTIDGTRIAVRDVVQTLRANDDYSPETLVTRAFPHITLAQVYDALSYYHDHTAEIEHLIDTKELKAEDVADGPRNVTHLLGKR